MKAFWLHIRQNWKTSVSGFLSFVLATLTSVGGVMASLNLVAAGPQQMSLASIHRVTWIIFGINLATGLCKTWIGFLQKDAGQVLAAPADGGPAKLEPAHELPNDPNATPVVPAPKP